MDDFAPIAIATSPEYDDPSNDFGGSSGGFGSFGAEEPPQARRHLTRRQKAAVIVQLLLREGVKLPLEILPDTSQEALTSELASLRVIDRDTLAAVVHEFVEEMESIGLTFPDGLENALGALEGHISAATHERLRREAGIAEKGDPWERISDLPPQRLARVLEQESVEVGAVVLSKLSVAKAAQLLEQIPGDRARKISYAISRTGKVAPATVHRIGLSLAHQLNADPAVAFSEGPVERVGAILNQSRAAVRDDVLASFDETDQEFAAEVRRVIFTFANIPERITPRDIPRILRGIDQAVLVQALAFAATIPDLDKAKDFILENMSKRMADAVREEMGEVSSIKESDGEEAMGTVITEIRRMIDAGELLLVAADG